MSEQLVNDQAAIYKIFCNAAEGLVVDLTGPEVACGHASDERALEAASDYIEDLYDEGVGEDIDAEQVRILEYIAIAESAWFLVEDKTLLIDGRNFND